MASDSRAAYKVTESLIVDSLLYLEEKRYNRVICYCKTILDSFFIVYSKRTLRFIECFHCKNAV